MPLLCVWHILMHAFVVRLHKEVRKPLAEAEDTLRTLALPVPYEGLGGDPSQFFETQWIAQRTKQIDVMTETTKQKQKKLSILLALKEELVIAHKTRRARTQAENNELLAPPGSIVDIKHQIEAMANTLGGAEFAAVTGPTGNAVKATLAISLARDKMNEAKVGLVECCIHNHSICLKYTAIRQGVYQISKILTHVKSVTFEPITPEALDLNFRTMRL
ncbi:hypothetical protein DFH28DRAFT_1086681 [Melampsora americana]|nr:hypothetical protein DFH28DRAFT_1086681 [Melampsora americana]